MRSMIPAPVFAAMFAAVAAYGAGLAQAQTPVQSVRASYAVEPFTPSNQIIIQGTGVRLRAEPFATTDTPVLSTGSTGLPLNVIGIARLPDWNWYQVILKSGQKAFIRSDLTSAPSKGGAMAASLPSPARIDYPPASGSAVPPALASNPAFSPAAPPVLTPIDSAPLSAPVSAPASAPISAPAAPTAPLPSTVRPNVPPVSGAAPVFAPSPAPLAPDAPISLTPRSSLPPTTSDPSGLESKPPGQ